MIVADNAAGATRAYSAIETGKTFAKAALFRISNTRIQPIPTFPPDLAATAAPAASDSIPATAIRLPMAILVISAGSRNFFDQRRQKMTDIKRKLTETIESSVINQVVGICFL